MNSEWIHVHALACVYDEDADKWSSEHTPCLLLLLGLSAR